MIEFENLMTAPSPVALEGTAILEHTSVLDADEVSSVLSSFGTPDVLAPTLDAAAFEEVDEQVSSAVAAAATLSTAPAPSSLEAASRTGSDLVAGAAGRPARSGMLHERLDRTSRRAVLAPPVVVEGLLSDASTEAATAAAREIAVVWEQYKEASDVLLRERLILHYAPLVTSVASRVGMKLPSTVEHADLVSYGMFGLIDAIEKFEIDREIKFETYATTRIRGAILDELRASDWVPRSVRSKARAVDRAYAELEGALHRSPTDAEVAAHMEIPPAELRSIRHLVSTVNLVALDEVFGPFEQLEPVGHVDTQSARSSDPARTFESKETKFLLSQAMDQLGEREKIMLVLYYYEGMTLAEIGKVLGVTESRVSQMHTAAMARLRDKLARSGGA